MAESNLNINSYVKWAPSNGGLAVGQIVKIKEDKATVEGPTGLFNDVAIADLIESSEDEFNNSISDIVNKVSKKLRKAKASETKGEQMSDSQATVDYKAKSEQLEAALKAAEAKMSEMETECNAAKKAMEDQCAAIQKAMDETKAQLSTANQKLQDIETEKVISNRFNQLKSVDAIASISEDEDEVKSVLGKMDEATFATIVKVATASFKKLTDASAQTQLPKLTDQTQTQLPKSTDAKASDVTSEEVIEKATLEKDPDLAVAAASSTGGEVQALLQEFCAKRFSLNKKDKENKK